MRWSHVNWPAVGYVSLEDVDGYHEHLARLVTDAPPPVAALASVHWDEARVERWDRADDRLVVGFVVRNDEVLDTPQGLYRRWNHGRVTLRFARATLEPTDVDSAELLAGDVHVSRGELDHLGGDEWELRLLVTPVGEVAVRFTDVAVTVERVSEDTWNGLEARPAHGWHGAVPDGWVDHATPAVRAAAHGDVGGLSLVLDGIGTEPAGVDEVDPRWGLTALHAAAWFDRRGATEALLERGARLDVLDAEDRTPLDLARERGSHRAEELLLAAATRVSRSER